MINQLRYIGVVANVHDWNSTLKNSTNIFQAYLISFLSVVTSFANFNNLAPQAPNDKMKEVLMKTVEEAKALISNVSLHLINRLRSSFDLF